MKKYKIYCYTNTKNNKKYIGQTYRTLEQRAGINGKEYTKKQSLFSSAIKCYGWDCFQPTILKDNLTLKEANYWEEYYIAYYHTWMNDPQCWGYNMQKGGNNHSCKLGSKSDETKKKMSLAKQNHIVSEETKQKLRKIQLAKLSKEYKEKKSKEKKIICEETNTVYNSIKEASEKTGICYHSLCDNLHNRRKSAGKMHWHFYKENDIKGEK